MSLEIGDEVYVTSNEHNLTKQQGVVTITNLFGKKIGLGVKIISSQQHYAFFGKDARCVTPKYP